MRLTRRRAAGLVLAGLAAGGGWLTVRRAPAQPGPAVSVPAVEVPAVRPGRAYTVTAPAGGFAREFAGGERIGLWFGDDRLTAELTLAKGDAAERVFLEADFAVNREGVVFGVVTAAEADGADAGRFVGMPFAVRVRLDGGGLTVREVRADPAAGDGVREVLAACVGRYAASTSPPVSAARKPAKPVFPRPTAVPAVAPLPVLPPALPTLPPG